MGSSPRRAPTADDRARMRESVARFEERRRHWRADAGTTLAAALAVAGLGWLVVVPAVLGAALGRALDARYGTGVTFAAALGLVGLGFGCWSAWGRVARLRERRPRAR